MATPLGALSATAFTLGGTAMLGVLKDITVSAENDLADGAGLANRYEANQSVKQTQKFDFTVFQNNSGGLPASNLDIALWTIGGTAYLTNLRSGSIKITNETKEASSVAGAYKLPNLTRTKIQITSDQLIYTSAALTETLLTGTEASFLVAAALTVGVEAFVCPMILKSSKMITRRGELQMENITLAGQGTPTGPADASLLGTILIGTAAISVLFDSGGNTYKTGTTQLAVMTSLDVQIKDGAIVEQRGTLEMQGGMVVAIP